ncbi:MULTISPECIES: hypothetical protein [unclassified Streptomyces]|uniref:hypothetical protein n=1 Tax=unclassified Streptomyces TaxID=2593676 RepID=UPI001F04EA66|nr:MULTISPECIES: hypothetical protein [unclassified Streptomyces]MCH0566263.1 hypothetical protein [Streptomyces sp. MUM 2J]MCH0572419.1 hypothetical protein [Streptomyces sp. MUM 136J]
MPSLRRATAVLVLAVAAAGCTDHSPSGAVPSRSAATAGKTAPSELPSFSSDGVGNTLLEVTGRGTGRHRTPAVPAGEVTAEIVCTGRGVLSADFDDAAGKVLYQVVSQPCDPAVSHKVTFGVPAEPEGIVVAVTARDDGTYGVLLGTEDVDGT